VVNPPAAEKYGFWTNPDLPESADDWLAGAKQGNGSWWLEWDRWLAGFAGSEVKAREPKNGIEDAPGSYVKVRLI
jgi:polyhydroxyalkanoate synthase subunit PhaC